MCKKIAVVSMITFCLLCGLFSIVSAEEPGYTEKSVKVIKEGEEAGELPLRFYEETPNVPYIGLCEYSMYMKQQPLSFEAKEDGTCVLTNENGEEILCNTDEGVIYVQDWNRFFDPALPCEGAQGYKDSKARFVRVVDVAYDGEAKPVELDFAKYGIPIYSDQDDVYLPVSTCSNMLTDIATNHLLYNGENLYACRMSLSGEQIEGFYDSDRFQAEFQGQERPEDIVKQCYADLCFNFDYFFGHPGKAALDADIAEKGLDQSLTDMGEKGASIKEGLFSSDFSEYISAMQDLFTVYLSDGHTLFTSGMEVLNYLPFLDRGKLGFGMISDILKNQTLLNQTINEFITLQRDSAWGDETYREFGNTAIIRLDDFNPDEKAWDSYYKGEGDLPEDSLGIVVSGLRKAAENPEIENVIFDLTCNAGGSSDVLMAILGMTTGQDQLYGLQKLTDREMTITFEADTNLDGVFDEKDKEDRYDFNYGVLTSRHAFSCGNLLPIIMQEGGAVVIGEPTTGGSCCVQIGSDTEGMEYCMSSCQWQLLDAEGNDVEGGCTVDLPIEPESNGIVDTLVGFLNEKKGYPSFENYYDDERLNEMMNEWFQDQSEAEEAA